MIPQVHPADRFKQQMRDLLWRETSSLRAIKIAKHAQVYTSGDCDKTVYFIESGQIKLLMLSPEGKECLLAIYTAGDVFGEMCLSGSDAHPETAVAMEKTILKQIPCCEFLTLLSRDSLLEGFVQYLAARIVEQQQVIANLVTADSEQRLGKTLLQLAHKLGQQDPRSIRLEHKITHEELAEMVGASRPRISTFMHKFRELGLIEMSKEHHL
ncbi:MAG: Crp/Fnr family transcriptional regulator, partial [Acidobacteriota bacterium]